MCLETAFLHRLVCYNLWLNWFINISNVDLCPLMSTDLLWKLLLCLSKNKENAYLFHNNGTFQMDTNTHTDRHTRTHTCGLGLTWGEHKESPVSTHTDQNNIFVWKIRLSWDTHIHPRWSFWLSCHAPFFWECPIISLPPMCFPLQLSLSLPPWVSLFAAFIAQPQWPLILHRKV